jgi:hypothetical protein
VPGGNGEAGFPVISPTARLDTAYWNQVFNGVDKVRLTTAVGGTIEGIIPPGKTLEIAGTVPIYGGGTLTINGTVKILETTGNLTNGGGSGYTVPLGGTLRVEGNIFLSSGLSAAGVSFGPSGKPLATASNDADDINDAFAYADTIDWPRATALTASDINDLDHWTGTKKLILSGNNTPSTSLDLSGKGLLEITAELTLGNNIILKGSSGTGNITVADTGSIVLGNATAALDGGITVNGTISAGGGITTAAIPSTVKLTAATLESTSGGATFTLPAALTQIGGLDLGAALTVAGPTAALNIGEVSNSTGATLTLPAFAATVGTVSIAGGALTVAGPTALSVTTLSNTTGGTALVLPSITPIIGTLDLGASLAITGAAGLNVTMLSNSAASTLTLPTSMTSVSIPTIATDDTNPLTIAGSGGSVELTAGLVTGDAGLILTATSVTVGTAGIIIDADSKITTTAITPFTDAAGLSLKAKGTGTVDLGNTALAVNAPLTFGPKIAIGTQTATVTANAVFSNGLTAATVTNATAGGPVTLTLGGDLTGALTAAVTGLTLTGNNVAVSGVVTTTADLTVTGTVAFSNASNVITSTGSLIVSGLNSAVNAGANLVFGPGVYEADTDAVTYGTNKITTAATATLTLGTIVLSDTGASDSFVASGAPVILSSVSDGSITIPAGGDVALGGAATLELGNGTVALGNGGTLSLVNGSVITGFIDTDADLKAENTNVGGVILGDENNAGYDGTDTLTASNDYVLTGGASGGNLTKDSDIAET